MSTCKRKMFQAMISRKNFLIFQDEKMEEWKKAQLAEAKCCTGCAIGDDKGQWCEGVCACETVIINDISIHSDDLDDYLKNKWNQLQQKNLSPTKINKVIQPTPLKLLQWKNVDDLVRQLTCSMVYYKQVRSS